MVSVIFPAAGQGSRMKAGKNKVLLELGGKPILLRTLESFSRLDEVRELIVVTGRQEMEEVRAILEGTRGLKPWQLVEGSTERQYSIRNGLNCVSEEAGLVLVHDAARPLITAEVIRRVIEGAKEFGGAIAAVPEKNTVKIVDDNGMVVSTPPRKSLWAVQTPQGFRKDILLEANDRAEAEGFLGTDDASLVERLGRPVKVVEGDYRNIKLTTPEDMVTAEAFLQQMKEEE
ncbi:2-C-methyl-D-erythritol 4-phosphate cytidylyltransferase [Selenomonas sp. KH1T6]|uniref:2-C-methyl-D-erythritol 4-phosphate cytidylyltransferase n=1 Tax=Selenomonas sp. KH1T6 TaxID=3158784 RepID=UPI0008A76F0D|nr:2-C-methyl-D-erythritol 4-phosphate cytidylyltransferase/2-C-methyl-D-erythritol 4-phosphate cytidylyltransferase / 2-C-methyl-D-erythritol 2,4-cyclodiphosphate synthase [Selenomonas ruminantium]